MLLAMLLPSLALGQTITMEQAQQGGFASAVSANQAQLPVAVQIDRGIVKYRFRGTVVCKCKILNCDLSHMYLREYQWAGKQQAVFYNKKRRRQVSCTQKQSGVRTPLFIVKMVQVTCASFHPFENDMIIIPNTA